MNPNPTKKTGTTADQHDDLGYQQPIEPANPQAAEQLRGTEYDLNYAPHEPVKSPYLHSKFYNLNAAAYNLLRRNQISGYAIVIPKEKGQYELESLGAIRRSVFDPITGLNY